MALVDLKALSACTLLTVAWERTYRYFSFHITDTQDLLPGVGRLTLLQLYDEVSERALRDPSKFTSYSYRRSVTVPKLGFIEDWLSLLFIEDWLSLLFLEDWSSLLFLEDWLFLLFIIVSFCLTLGQRFCGGEVVLAISTLMMRYFQLGC